MLIPIHIGTDILIGIHIRFGIREFWYETGLYFGVGGFGIWGMPGYGFSNWFFNGGRYNRYPNLYHQFGNYYRSNIASNRVMDQ